MNLRAPRTEAVLFPASLGCDEGMGGLPTVGPPSHLHREVELRGNGAGWCLTPSASVLKNRNSQSLDPDRTSEI